MPAPIIDPRGITISFEKEEIAWLYWVMTEIVNASAITHTAKNKIITAYDLTHADKKSKDNQNVE